MGGGSVAQVYRANVGTAGDFPALTAGATPASEGANPPLHQFQAP